MFNDEERDDDAIESAVAAKLRAQASELRSRAFLRWCGGGALILSGVGLLALLAGEGVSRGAGAILAANESAKTRAATLANERDEFHAMLANERDELIARLTGMTFHAQGTVNGTVTLADDQQVKVSGNVGIKDDARVALSVPPDATIGMRSANDAARPTAAQLQADAKPASGAPVLTDFVIFKTAPYGRGEVQSGWQFADSNAQAPSKQWCLYTETENGNGHDVRLGLNGHRVDLPSPPPFPSVDLQAAFASCVWTATAAPARVNRDDNPPPPRHVITARAKG